VFSIFRHFLFFDKKVLAASSKSCCQPFQIFYMDSNIFVCFGYKTFISEGCT